MTLKACHFDLAGPWTKRVEYYDYVGEGVAFRPCCV